MRDERWEAVGSWHPAMIIFDLLLTHGKDNHLPVANTQICLHICKG